MTHPLQTRIPATYMRGGTSKGVFFCLDDLPERCRVPGEARDRLFQRVIGSPDPYAAHIDGMGGATRGRRAARCSPLAIWSTTSPCRKAWRRAGCSRPR